MLVQVPIEDREKLIAGLIKAFRIKS